MKANLSLLNGLALGPIVALILFALSSFFDKGYETYEGTVKDINTEFDTLILVPKGDMDRLELDSIIVVQYDGRLFLIKSE